MGTLALRNSLTAFTTNVEPSSAITTGLSNLPITSFTAFATSSALNIGGGGRMTIAESTLSSWRRISRHWAYCSGDAEASMSTGLWMLAAGGRMADKAVSVDSLNWARIKPSLSSESAAMTPGPPALVTIPILFPFGSGQFSNACAQSNICSAVSARRMPAFSKAASKAVSEAASAPVCDAAAFCPASKRPTFNAITGFCLAASLAC